MKILSINVGIWTRNRSRSDANYWKTRARSLREMIAAVDADVICLQELWLPHNFYIPRRYKKVGGTGVEHPIYVRRGLKTEHTIFRIYWSMTEIGGIDVYNVHGGLSSKSTTELCRELRDVYLYRGRETVIAGDFNASIDALDPQLQALSSARVLADVEKRDTFENFTRPAQSHGEIDHVFVSSPSVKSYGLISSFGGVRFSDHSAVVVEI